MVLSSVHGGSAPKNMSWERVRMAKKLMSKRSFEKVMIGDVNLGCVFSRSSYLTDRCNVGSALPDNAACLLI